LIVLDKFLYAGHNATMLIVKKNGFATPSIVVIVAFCSILVAASGIAIYFYLQYQHTQTLLTKSTKDDVQSELLRSVGKLIVLPSNEQPTIATVSDVKRLKGQSFFAHARNGDKVLIYTKAQEAILYDPLADKIVAVGPVSLTQVTPTQAAMPVTEPVTVVIYNGTTTVGLATTIQKSLEQKMSNVTVTAKGDAQGTYTKTLVVDLSGVQATSAAALARVLNAKVSSMPSGEIKPKKADILIILGK
jgi:LytR cell envelope-related transcriptional attenuator